MLCWLFGWGAKFRIVRRDGADPRLEADVPLSPASFTRIAARLRVRPRRARKVGFVAARKADAPEVIETRWNGKETSNTARAGDFVVTNLDPQRNPLRDADGNLNVYVIAADRFASLYEAAGEAGEHGSVHRAKGIVSAIRLAGGLDIVAPWGERQRMGDGYLLANGRDVYGNSRETFEATYEILPD